MTREEAMQSFVTSYTVTGSRIGHKSARIPIDHAVLPEHAEAACGAKVLVIRAGADAPPFDSERLFSCTNCKRTLATFPPPFSAIAANKRRSENTQRANALIEAVGAMFRRHDAKARKANFTACGCEDCLALKGAVGIEAANG